MKCLSFFNMWFRLLFVSCDDVCDERNVDGMRTARALSRWIWILGGTHDGIDWWRRHAGGELSSRASPPFLCFLSSFFS